MKRVSFRALLFVLALITLTSCSRVQQPFVLLPANPQGETPVSWRWHEVTFSVTWPEHRPIDWGLAALIAAEVIAPQLRTHAGDIPLWRFHRRAARDKTGHTFRWLFVSSEEVLQSVTTHIQGHPDIQGLLRVGLLRDVTSNPVIGSAADASWPENLQRAWPYFIMGVSASWLSLVEDQVSEEGRSELSLKSKLALYRKAHRELLGDWRRYGQHAFLHHLNAIFAYQPVDVHNQQQF